MGNRMQKLRPRCSKYRNWCDREKRDAKVTIQKTKREISDLQSDLQTEDAFRKKVSTELEKLAAEASGNEADLKKAETVRQHERAAYLQVEKTLVQSIDSLERAIDVMGKKAPALPQTGSANLAHVASMLQSITQGSPDLALSAGQQSTLNAFFQNTAAAQSRKMGSDLNFLQVDSNEDFAKPSYGNYQSKGGGVTDTLRTILQKNKREKSEQ